MYTNSADSNYFGLDAGGLDHRPPFLDLGLVERGEAFGGLQLARGDVEPEIGEARAHRGSASAWTIAAFSFEISFGVPLGAKNPNQPAI